MVGDWSESVDSARTIEREFTLSLIPGHAITVPMRDSWSLALVRPSATAKVRSTTGVPLRVAGAQILALISQRRRPRAKLEAVYTMHRKVRCFLLLTMQLIGSATAEVRDGLPTAAPRVGPSVRHSNHVGGHATWCALHFVRREYRLAIEDCDEALTENPTDADTYSNRGGAYLMISEPDRAMQDFETAIRLKPDDVLLHYNLAGALMQKGEHAKAVAAYTEAIRLDPGLAPAYNNRGYALELLGERERAITDYHRALELAPALSTPIRKNLRRLGAE